MADIHHFSIANIPQGRQAMKSLGWVFDISFRTNVETPSPLGLQSNTEVFS